MREKIDDKQFDLLIGQALARERQVQQMNARIVQAVRRNERKRTARMWLRVVAFALFVPISALAFVGCAQLVVHLLGEVFGMVVAAPIIITGILTEISLVADFSPEKV
ncbi:MAG: hypothetical protein IKL67_05055 [Tidjanibacter sp.]|nr:hypothetical protein [Tidjanibacter sp.]